MVVIEQQFLNTSLFRCTDEVASIRLLLGFNEDTQINRVANAVYFVVGHFVFKLVLLIIIIITPRKTSTHHSSQDECIQRLTGRIGQT